MSYVQRDIDEAGGRARHLSTVMGVAWLMGRTVVWAVINVALVFTEQVAELLAPLLLLAGAVWWALPRVLGLIVLDGQANDVLRGVTAKLPTEIMLAGHWLSAATLVTDAFLLFALVAVCRTLAALMTRMLFSDR